MDVRIGCVTIQVRMLNEIHVYMSKLCMSFPESIDVHITTCCKNLVDELSVQLSFGR